MSGSDGTLSLSAAVARGVLDHALRERPLECCGILLGPGPDRAERVLEAANVHENPRTRYEIDPDTLLEAVQAGAAGDEQVVGFYHSHPRGAAAFSRTDRARGSWEGLTYLLVSLDPLTFLAGRWNGEDFSPVDVRVPGDASP